MPSAASGEIPVTSAAPSTCGWAEAPWVAAALFLAPFLLYAQGYDYGLLGIDDTSYYGNPLLRETSALWKVWADVYMSEYLPIMQLTFWLDLAVGGSGGFAFARVQQLVWLGVGTLAVRAVCTRLTGRRDLSTFVAMLYAVHPVNADGTLWLAERKSVLAFAFTYWSIERYLAARSEDSLRWGAWIAALALGGLGLLSKPHAVALPGMLLAYELCMGRGSWGRRAVALAPFVAMTGLYTFLSLTYWRGDLIREPLGGSRIAAVISTGPILWRYGAHVLAPIHLSFVYAVQELAPSSVWGWCAWLGATVLLALAAWPSSTRKAVLCGGLMGLAALVPALNLVPQIYPMSDHYLQWALPVWLLAPLLLLDAACTRWFPARGHRPVTWLACLAAFLLACLTLARVPEYASAYAVLDHAVRQQPQTGLAWAPYAAQLNARNGPESAVGQACVRALESPDAHRLLPHDRLFVTPRAARFLYEQGQTEAALALIERSFVQFQHGPNGWPQVMRAEALFYLKRHAEALASLEPLVSEEQRRVAASLRERCAEGTPLPQELPPFLALKIEGGDAYDTTHANFVEFRMLFLLSRTYMALGQNAQAFDWALVLGNMFPHTEASRLLLAVLYEQLGKPEAARRLRTRARNVPPGAGA
ncbi:MAG: hypothetical protein AMXMBFR7_04680 [Planctomycetota bacterium]